MNFPAQGAEYHCTPTRIAGNMQFEMSLSNYMLGTNKVCRLSLQSWYFSQKQRTFGHIQDSRCGSFNSLILIVGALGGHLPPEIPTRPNPQQIRRNES